MKVHKQKQSKPRRDYHEFTTLEEHARLHPIAHRMLVQQYGTAFLTQTMVLKNPLKTRQTVVFHIGQPSLRSPHFTRFKNKDNNVHVVLEPGEMRELPLAIADAAHLIDEDMNLVVGGRAPALRIIENGEDVTPELHASLRDSLPDDSPTRPRARRR